jgi:hypothetical protein
MNCEHSYELLTASVDNELVAEAQQQLDAHLSECSHCAKLYEIELATKQLLRTMLPPLKTPWKVRADIIEKIRIEAGTEAARRPSFFQSLWKPAFAFGGALAVVFLTLAYFFNSEKPPQQLADTKSVSPSAQESKTDKIPVAVATEPNPTEKPKPKPRKKSLPPILNESMTDFDLFLQGKKKPEKFTSHRKELEQYLAARVNFPVRLPEMSDCELIGGVVSQFQNEQIAQVMYSHRGHNVALFQTTFNSFDDLNLSFLPESAQTILKKGNWYIDDSDSNCCITMWIDKTVLYYAVSNADKKEIHKELFQGFKTINSTK